MRRQAPSDPVDQWAYNEDLRQRCGPDVLPLAPWLRPLQRIMQVPLCSTTDLLPSIAFHVLHPNNHFRTTRMYGFPVSHAM